MNDKTLVQRLRDRHVCSIAQNSCRNDYICEEAATRIEALEAEKANAAVALTTLSAENEKLRVRNACLEAANGILEDGLCEVGDDYPGSSCQEWCVNQIKQARQALAGDDHGHR